MRYANKNGRLCDKPQRKFFFIVDGIIGQEGWGPMQGDPKRCGVVIVGANPCIIDYVSCKVMGFNPYYLKVVIEPFKKRKKMNHSLVDFSIDEIKVISNVKDYININILSRRESLRFQAPQTWKIIEKSDFF
ncbi:MAG: DUF362 domain-containing protein [Nitrososphaeria archaeon]